MLLGGASHARAQLLADAGAQLDRRSVGAHPHRIAVRDPPRRRVLRPPARAPARAAGTAARGRAPRRDRRTAAGSGGGGAALLPPSSSRPLGRRRLVVGRCARRKRRPLADLAEGHPAEGSRRDLGEDLRRMRRELDVEARGQLGQPGELVGRRRGDRAAEALEASLEVHVRPVALEIARSRQDEVGPAAHELSNIAITSTCSACSASVRTFGSAAASSPDTIRELDRLRVGRRLVCGAGPRVGDAPRVRRRGQVERARAFLPGEAELVCDRRERDPSVSAAARPDQDRRGRWRECARLARSRRAAHLLRRPAPPARRRRDRR